MASIQTAIMLNDMVSGPLREMYSVMNTVIDSFETMQHVSGNAVDISNIQQARAELAKCDAAFTEIENSTKAANKQQQNYNRSIGDGASGANNLLNKVKGIAATYASIRGIQNLMNVSDTVANTNAKLNLIVDDGGSVAELENKVMASANRSRAAYIDTANAVSRLAMNAGAAFNNNNDDIIRFTELVNKQFKIGGASAQEQSAAMLQLTQAMASGVLRGDELNSIFEQAPQLVQNIADYLGVSTGQIRAMASEGQITADIVKNAVFNAADDINSKFNEMPMTWADVFNQMANTALIVLQPLLNGINFLANNIAIIAPLVIGLSSVFVIFLVYANWAKICAAATRLWAGAQSLLNMIMSANPIIIVVTAIILLIAVVYAATAAYNRFAHAGVSATGLIGGAFGVLIAFMYNTFLVPLRNGFATVANFIGNVFNNPVAAVEVLFLDMCKTVLGYIQNLISGIESLINKIPGIEVSLTGGIDNLYNYVSDTAASVRAKSGYKEYFSTVDYMDYSSAAAKGYSIGSNIANKISKKFGFGDTSSDNSKWIGDYTGGMGIPNSVADTAKNTGRTADSTAGIAKTLDITNENLKYLRDIAERSAINRYTTASITIHQKNYNKIKRKMDLDGITNHITTTLEQQMRELATEGVHY